MIPCTGWSKTATRLRWSNEVESRFAISNGFLGVRASLEQPTIASRPRSFIAGLFDAPPSEVPLPRLVPGPD